MTESRTTVTEFYVGGMACAFCAATIEKGLRGLNGVASSNVLVESGEVFIRHNPAQVGKDQLKREMQRLGYYVFEGRENMSSLILTDSRTRALRTWALATLSFLLIFPIMFPELFPLIQRVDLYGVLAFAANFVLATVVFFYFALPVHRGTIVALRKRILNEHVLYGVAGFASYILGLIGFFIPAFRPFFFVAILLTGLHLTAGWLGARLRFRVEKSIRMLLDLRPLKARVLHNEEESEVPISEVRVDDFVVVKPGEKIPLDGTVVDGASDVSEAILTGESVPVLRGTGEEVIGGSTNGSGRLTIRVTSGYSSSYVSRILGLVRSAKQSRSTILTFFDTMVDRVWVPLVLALALITFVAWTLVGVLVRNPVFLESGLVAALLVAVIGYPCAIGFSSPSVGLSVFSTYAENGILVKDASIFERLKNVKTVIFDKTGTLTYGNPKLLAMVSVSGVGEATAVRLAASLEQESTHPVARAIVDEAKRRNLELPKGEDFTQVSGAGVKGRIEGKEVILGSAEFLKSKGYDSNEVGALLRQFPGGAKSPIVVGVAGRVIGIFDISDAVRPDAKAVVSELKRMGVDVLMVTGDTPWAASEIAKGLGIRFLARRKPSDKIADVQECKRRGKVLMIGDGVNDAAALATADVGIATTASIDISKDVADAVLVSGSLSGIITLLRNARSVARATAGNILLALSFNVVGIPLAMLGILTVSDAMAIMVLSLLGVFANAYITKFRLTSRLRAAASNDLL